MSKIKIVLVILFVLFMPIISYAESNYLYDVLKDEAESNGLAKEYIGEHHDSFIKEPSKKIYYWHAENSTEAASIKEKSNTIFGGFCWLIIRTTDIGGVKLLYNGKITDGRCSSGALGGSYFNNDLTTAASVGYMYNTVYQSQSKKVNIYERVYNTLSLSRSYYYADSYSYNENTNEYTLENPYQTSSTNYSDLVGKYTFRSQQSSLSSTKIYYIIGVKGSDMYYVELENGNSFEHYNTHYTYGNNYVNNGDGTYTISNPTTIDITEYKSNYSRLKNKYICKNSINNTCSNVWYNTSVAESYMYYIPILNAYKYSSSFTYDDNTRLYTLGNDSVSFYDTSNSDNIELLSNHHYTCFNDSGVCEKISYVFRYTGYELKNILLEDGMNIDNALEEMLYADDVNKVNSTIKTKVDAWYEENLINLSNHIEDTIYCNDRSIIDYGGYKSNGGSITQLSQGTLKFNNYSDVKLLDLTCANETDKFSISNPKAKLIYPIGLLTTPELNLLNYVPSKSGEIYWVMSPDDLTESASMNYANNTGIGNLSSGVNSNYGVRPVISIEPESQYYTGDGTADNPYKIEYNYSVNVEIKNETKDLSINIDDLEQVNEGEEVTFRVTPIKGYKVTGIEIKDSSDNPIAFSNTGNNNEYSFIMPDRDVIIIPSYERVSNAVNTDDNKHTKEIKIEVNDVKAVVYEDMVRFTVVPEDGYELEDIIITDEEGNNIEYRKTNKENEYEFSMPDVDVLIKPIYRRIDNNGTPNNPKTGRNILIGLLLIIIICSTIKVIRRNNN